MGKYYKTISVFFFFFLQDLDKIAEANELFDAVLTGSVNQDNTTFTKEDATKQAQTKNEDTSVEKAAQGNSKRRLAIYIGNFPWVSLQELK